MSDVQKNGLSDFRKELAEKIIKAVSENRAPWQKQWESGHASSAENGKSGQKYKGVNAINLAFEQIDKGYQRNDWYTYKQATELGGQVRKGEKGTRIELWRFTETVDVTDEAGKPVFQDGKPVKQEVKLDHPRVQYFTVFNGDQIDNLPERKLSIEQIQQRKIEAVEIGEKLLENAVGGMEVNFKHVEGDKAFYRRSQDVVVMPKRDQFLDAGGYYSTALHELGHATGHESRLNRDLGNHFGTAEYAREELRAEIASWMLSAEIGLPHDPTNHAAYLDSWMSALKKDPNELYVAIKDASKIVDFIKDKALEHEQSKQQSKSIEAEQDDDISQNPNAITEIDVDGIVYRLKPVKAKEVERERYPSAREATGLTDREEAQMAQIANLQYEVATKNINWTVDNAHILSPAGNDELNAELKGIVAAETSIALYLQVASKTVIQVDKTRIINDKGITGVAHPGDYMDIEIKNGRYLVHEHERESDRKIDTEQSFENAKTAAQIELGSTNFNVERIDNENGTRGGVEGKYLLETSGHIVVHKPGSSEITIAAKSDLVRNKDQAVPQRGDNLSIQSNGDGKWRVSTIERTISRSKNLDL